MAQQATFPAPRAPPTLSPSTLWSPQEGGDRAAPSVEDRGYDCNVAPQGRISLSNPGGWDASV